MMTETRKFPVRDILTVTTGRLLTKSPGPDDNGISALYELLGWMTKDEPFTHQLPRFADECRPWLLRWFPELANETFLGRLEHVLDRCHGCSATDIELTLTGFFDAIHDEFPAIKRLYDVPRIPQDDHERKHPVDELVAMRGTDEDILVVGTGGQPE